MTHIYNHIPLSCYKTIFIVSITKQKFHKHVSSKKVYNLNQPKKRFRGRVCVWGEGGGGVLVCSISISGRLCVKTSPHHNGSFWQQSWMPFMERILEVVIVGEEEALGEPGIMHLNQNKAHTQHHQDPCAKE